MSFEIDSAWEIYKSTQEEDLTTPAALKILQDKSLSVRAKQRELTNLFKERIMSDGSTDAETKQLLLNSLAETPISTAEIRQTMKDNKIPRTKSARNQAKGKRIYENINQHPVKAKRAGEGIHTYRNPARKLLAQEGYNIPKGKEIHHLNGMHDINHIENMAFVKPDDHQAFHMMNPTQEDAQSYLDTPMGEEEDLRRIMYGMEPPKPLKPIVAPSQSFKNLINRTKAVMDMDQAGTSA
jgi:hypothetical protein